MQIADETTGLSTLTLDSDDDIYTLNGLCLGKRSAQSKLPMGIYIYKGKKIFIK